MKRISNLVTGYVRTFNLAVITVLSLTLIFGGSAVTDKVKGVATTVFYYPFAKLKSTVLLLSETAERNEELQQTIRETTRQVELLQELARENERLRAIIDFKPPPEYALVQSRVISVAVAGGAAPVSAVINRGSHDGLKVDMPVINQEGLIGRVASVFDDVATVQLLTDPTQREAVRIAETREMGIVRYSNRDGMMLDNFPSEADIEVGQQVLSSGLGGIYPAGLIIGTVKTAMRPEEEPFWKVGIDQAANVNAIEELFVLKVRQP